VRNPSRGADSVWGTADDDLGDVHLKSGSPAIDAGSNSNVPSNITTDLDGNARFADIAGVHDPGVIVDIGAYEATTALLAKTIAASFTSASTSVSVTFNENLDPVSVAAGDLSISNVGTGATIDAATDTSASYSASTFAGVWNFTSPLPNGN